MLLMHHLKNAFILPLFLFAPLLGCTSSSHTLITSFKDLTSDVDREGRNVDQNRIFSISGSMPQAYPGQILRFSRKRGVETGFGLTNGQSYVQMKTISAPDNALEKMKVVRESILAAQEAGANYAQVRLKLLGLEAVAENKSEPDGGPKDPSSGSIETVEDEGSNATEEKSGSNATKEDGLQDQVVSVLQRTQESALEAKANLDAKIAAAAKVINESGLVVVRWDVDRRSKGRLSTLLNLDWNKEEAIGGYAILAGLRESTLFVGPDLASDGGNLGHKKQWNWGVMKFGIVPWFGEYRYDPNVRITTHTMQTRNLMYLQDSKSADHTEFELSLTYDQLKDIPKTLKEAGTLEIEHALSRLKNLSNQGILSDPDWSRTPVFLWGSKARKEHCARRSGLQDHDGFEALSSDALLDRRSDGNSAVEGAAGDLLVDGWITLFAVDANYWELLKMFKSR